MGKGTVSESEYKNIEKKAKQIAKENQKFERIVLTKDECLELFAENPFKVELIKAKIADGASTTAYRCGPLIDLCPGAINRIAPSLFVSCNLLYTYHTTGDLPPLVTRCNLSHCPCSSLLLYPLLITVSLLLYTTPGPHIPSTGKVQAFKVMKTSSAYWTGDNERDILQRVYGVSMPQPKLLKVHHDCL